MVELLQQLIASRVERQPEAVALVMGRERMTYGQLEEASNRLARLLRALGCRQGDRIALAIPKSPAAIVGIFGVLKADCVYVPIDLSSPPARVAKILDSCESRWVLAAGPAADLLDTLGAPRQGRQTINVGWLSATPPPAGKNFVAHFTEDDLSRCPTHPLDYQNRGGNVAHILFTSGSTGVPKGVMITHANVLSFVTWANRYFQVGSADRNSGHPPLHFDLSTYDIFGTLAAGAQLHLVPPQLNLLPNKLAEFIRNAELTRWFSVPSVLNYMAKFDTVRFNDFPALRRVLWCGEVLPTPTLIYWMRRLPHVQFTNLYGPTETTIASSYYTVARCPEDERQAIPIGAPCEGEELLVLNERQQPVPVGEVGDLYIRGVGLSPGYWRDPEKTREVFLPNPCCPGSGDRVYRTGDLAKIGEDGQVYFLGRADSQVKSRGYRIELGEIEAALNALGYLEECAVVAVPSGGFEGVSICCAYQTAAGAAIEPPQLRKDLGKMLPSYMLPSRWRRLASLPHNANGKIDRRKLREEFQDDETPASRSPRG